MVIKSYHIILAVQILGWFLLKWAGFDELLGWKSSTRSGNTGRQETQEENESNAVSLSFLRVYICFLWWILGLQYRNVRWKHMHLMRDVI